MSENPASPDHLELVTFWAGGQEFCIDVQSVREIRSYTPATPLPHAPAYVSGVINLRGTVLPIVDLAHRLGLRPTETNARSAIIVTDLDGHKLGLLVDAMSSIMGVIEGELQPPPKVGFAPSTSFVDGILAMEGRMVSLLSVQGILTEELELAA